MRYDERFPETYERIFFPPDVGVFLSCVRSITPSLDPAKRSVAEAFEKNLVSSMSVASLPFRMAESSVLDRRFQAVYMAQRIRSRNLKDKGSSEEECEKWALQTARKIFAEELAKGGSNPPLGDIPGQVLADLTQSLKNPEFESSTLELLRQCTVLCWGALEVLASDLFVAMLNENPRITAALLRDPRTRSFYQPRDFASALEERSYNLSACMGEVLLGQHRMDDVDTLRAVFDVVLPIDPGSRALLTSELLWRISQDRNLIVHRRGVVDRQYVASTGSELPPGAPLEISAGRYEEYLSFVRNLGCGLLAAAARGKVPEEGAESGKGGEAGSGPL